VRSPDRSLTEAGSTRTLTRVRGESARPAERFERAIAAIDAANRDDPVSIRVRGTERPKEIAHAELATEWVTTLRPDASEELLLAARGHHLRRWTSPRDSYPAGRAGYLRWRRDLHEQHAHELGEILTSCGYPPESIARVQSLVRKEGLEKPRRARASGDQVDPEVQTLEDALCLVFIETQLDDIGGHLDDDAKLVSVLEKTARKMSSAGLSAAATLSLGDRARRLLAEALRKPNPKDAA
jgi:hypothetical protein